MNLESYQQRWNEKPILRAIYGDLYQKIEDVVLVGDTLEIGGGIGNLHISGGRLIKSDIQHSVGIDVVADAQQLPFDNEVFSNIVLFDVFNQLTDLSQAFRRYRAVWACDIFLGDQFFPVTKTTVG